MICVLMISLCFLKWHCNDLLLLQCQQTSPLTCFLMVIIKENIMLCKRTPQMTHMLRQRQKSGSFGDSGVSMDWGVLTSCTTLSSWGDLADFVFVKHTGLLSFQIRSPGYTAGYHKPDSCSESVSVESEISWETVRDAHKAEHRKVQGSTAGVFYGVLQCNRALCN